MQVVWVRRAPSGRDWLPQAGPWGRLPRGGAGAADGQSSVVTGPAWCTRKGDTWPQFFVSGFCGQRASPPKAGFLKKQKRRGREKEIDGGYFPGF